MADQPYTSKYRAKVAKRPFAEEPAETELQVRFGAMWAYWDRQPAQLPPLGSPEAEAHFANIPKRPRVGKDVPTQISLMAQQEADAAPERFPFPLRGIRADAAMEAYYG